MSLNVKKCKRCGKIFQYMGRDMCPECVEKIDDCFVMIRDYLDEHPNAGIGEVSEALEIDEKIILDFIKSGRILLKEAVLKCMSCGRPIRCGEMCDECKAKITNKLAAAVKSKEKEEEKIRKEREINRTGGMHVKKTDFN